MDYNEFGEVEELPAIEERSAFEWEEFMVGEDAWVCPEVLRPQLHMLFRQGEGGVCLQLLKFLELYT
jgi:hypothetical protein